MQHDARHQGGYRVPVDVIKPAFRDLLEDWCVQWLPGGHRERHMWRCGSLAGEAGQSLVVDVRGPTTGRWIDYATGEKGDEIGLVAAVMFNGHVGKAIGFLIGYCGLGEVDERQLQVVRRQAREKRKAAEAEAKRQEADRRRRAWAMWHDEASAELRQTPVEGYLRGRGIDIGKFASLGALRFHPGCYCTEVGRGLPAMVALIVNAEGKPIAVHRTWLEVRPDGRVTKAPLDEPRKSLAAFRGGYISLAKGESGLPMSRAGGGETVYLAEGIEDALTLALANPAARCLSGVSLDNLGEVPVPASVGKLVICGDNPKSDKERAQLHRALRKHAKRGVPVELALPPEGYKDFNEMLTNWRGAA